MPLSLRAVLSTSRRKKVFFYFFPMKRVQDTCFKNSLVVLQFSFFASPQAKNHFWPDHLCEQRSKVSISKILSSAQRLQQCSSRNSILLQGAIEQTHGFALFLRSWWMEARDKPAGLRQSVTSLVYKLCTDMLFRPDLRLHFENSFVQS